MIYQQDNAVTDSPLLSYSYSCNFNQATTIVEYTGITTSNWPALKAFTSPRYLQSDNVYKLDINNVTVGIDGRPAFNLQHTTACYQLLKVLICLLVIYDIEQAQ